MIAYMRGRMWHVNGRLEGPAVFRLVANQLGGHLVSGLLVPVGCYIALVPATWSRDEDESGKAPIIPEPVDVDGYRAHYFFIDGSPYSRAIVFRDERGERVALGYLW